VNWKSRIPPWRTAKVTKKIKYNRRSTDKPNSLLGRLRILKSESGGAGQKPTPFDIKTRKIRRVLNISIAVAVVMMAVICFVPIEETYTAEGIVRPGNYQRLYAVADLEQREGPLVSEGDRVVKGQVLMHFHLPELEYKIMETKELLETLKGQLELQKARTASFEKLPLPKEFWEIKQQLDKSKFNRDYYESQLKRAQKLLETGDVSVQYVDQAKLEFSQANIEYERLTQRFELIDTGYTDTLLKEAKAQETQIEGRIEAVKPRLDALEKQLERQSVVKASVDGVVLDMPCKDIIGQIKAGRELVYMSTGSERMVEIFGMQRNFDKVKVGQKVRYKSQLYDAMRFRQAEGTVSNISMIRQQDELTASNANGGGYRYYSILATIDQQPRELKLDSSVTARIIVRKDRLIKVLLGDN